jgi:V8-like Glu-specific endopeptidase
VNFLSAQGCSRRSRHAASERIGGRIVLLIVSALAVSAIAAPGAGAIVGGTDQVDDAVTSSAAFIAISTTNGPETCSGTLISPNVVMTAAHCVYETTREGALVGIAQPSSISVHIGSREPSDVNLGTTAGVIAVLPQPYYRWEGAHHFHDIALLALDRSMPETPATLAEQRPDAGKALLIAGYGRTSIAGDPPPALRVGMIRAASPASCHLASESFDPSWLFCGTAVTDPTAPGGTACYGDSGGPAYASENTGVNVVVEGVISYGSRADCEHSRSYLVLVSSERGFIDHALATPPDTWAQLRDDPPVAKIRPIRLPVGHRGVITLRIDDDKSRRSRIVIAFYTRSGKQVSHAYRVVTTNRWARFKLQRQSQRFSGYVCTQGTDATRKRSNMQCAADVVR